MIDIKKAKIAFKDFLEEYDDREHVSFKLKVEHTYHVAENARKIAEELKLNKEDIELAELIGILHDIGRFEELKVLNELNSCKFNHAMHGSKMLFEQGMIKNFIEDRKYDEIIKKAIENHSKLEIEKGLDERTLLHSKIIRDADKLDNYRVKKEESIEAIFPTRVNKREDMEESLLSDKVYNAVLNQKCVDIHDRITPLDFWVCILAFTFDLNFDVTYKIVKEHDYINVLIDRFEYADKETKEKMENIRNIINRFVEEKI